MNSLWVGAVMAVVLGTGVACAGEAPASASPGPSASAQAPECKPATPLKEHTWLKQLEGEWDLEVETSMGPDKPPMKSTGHESSRMLGGFFLLTNMDIKMGEASMDSRMTIGYDVRKAKYVATFVCSMDGFMWTYEGTVDAAGKTLHLDTEGPNMENPGKFAKYKEAIEIVDADHRVYSSDIQTADGKWFRFMTAKYTRAKK